MPISRTVFRHAGIFLLLFGLSIPVAELAFRMVDGAPGAELAGLFEPFAGTNYKMASMVDTDARYPWGRTAVHTDGLGLRSDRERKFGVQPGQHLNALLLGDSQIFGSGLTYEETLAGHLSLHGSAQGIRIGDAAVNGHSVLDQLAAAKWLHETNKVSIDTYVLVMTCIMVKEPGHYYLVKVGADGRLYTTNLRPWMRAVMWLRTHSAAYGRIGKARIARREGRASGLFPIFVERFNTEKPEDAEEAKLVSALEEFKSWATAQGSKLVVVYLPIPLEIDPGENLEQAKRAGMNIDISRPRRICESASKKADLACLDLFPAVRAYQARGQPLNLKGDLHYTSEFWQYCWPEVWRFLEPAMSSRASL